MFDKYYYDYDDCTSIEDLIKAAKEASRTEYVWLVHRAVDYSNFDWRFLPNRHQSKFCHTWASHNNPKCYTTWFIPTNIEYQRTETVFHNEILPIENPVNGKLWRWITNENIDYSNFDFNWFPDVWDWQLNHDFTMAGKRQLSYTTLSRSSSETKYHWANLTFDKKYYDVCCIDTGTHALHECDFKVKLITTMQEALKAAINKSQRPWLWVISDVCDYTDFDFTWLPDADQEHHIHCWPSGECEKGDTFLINVINYINNPNAPYNFDHYPIQRKRWPNIKVTQDSLAQELKLHSRLGAIYTIYSYTGFIDYQDVCLWDKRPVVSINKNNSTSIVPRDCIVKEEMYEYPHLLRYPEYGFDALNDVIFISYDEPQADANWKIVQDRAPRAKRLHGVEGMQRALEEAARLSETDWYYAVFAKTRLHEDFDFSYQPDYWQKPKHYIFDCINTMNDLRYGHMGIIMYNKKIVLDSIDKPFGLDYTLSWEHAAIPVVSCYGEFNSTPFHTWRTAFRECCKMPYYNSLYPGVESDYRLYVWQNYAHGEYAEWCIQGARDGVAYYEANKDNFSELKRTFDWNWLRQYFVNLHDDIK